MIKKVYSANQFDKKKKKFNTTIFRDNQSTPGWLSYYFRTGAKIVALLVFSDLELTGNPKGSLNKIKKIYFKGSISRRSSVRKFVKMVVKQCSATMALTMEENLKGSISWASVVKDYVDDFPSTTILLAAYEGKILLKSRSVHQQEGKATESKAVLETIKDVPAEDYYKEEAPLRYISLLQTELPESSILGWPLLRKTASTSQEALRKPEAKNISVVQWVMNLPNRSNIDTCTVKEPEVEEPGPPLIQAAAKDELGDAIMSLKEENLDPVCEHEVEVSLSTSVSSDVNDSPKSKLGWPLLLITVPSTQDSLSKSEAANNDNSSLPSTKPANQLELISKLADSSGFRRFKYEELNTATSQFSSENLIGEGGCSSVYRGLLPSGKSVAVKVLKPYKEAWTDFSLEVNIVSSIKHKRITPLIGICLENSLLITVYDFFPKGSLEDYLHGGSGRSVFPWGVRFNVAIAVAEALNYLHNNCPQPVIHRDVKSSNILLTNELEPQLSDFGLAIWGSTDSAYSVHTDVVGTFGYIAPEYFMYGRISEKIDIYAFGVVLLELLSGKRPIGDKVPKGQESLVKWAKDLLERGDYKALLDPNLKEDIDVAQMQRMVLAARLCISQSTRARPKVIQILELLKGEKDTNELVDSHIFYSESGYEDDDDSFLEFGCRDRPGFQILNSDNGSISISYESDEICLTEKTQGFKLKDLLNQRLD